MRKLFVLGDRFRAYRPFEDMFAEIKIVKCMEDLNTLSQDDVILYEGGTDISTELYGEKKLNITGQPDIARDNFEKEVFDTFKGKALFFGICRGSQFLCAMSGGKLIQDVNGHGENHVMEYKFSAADRYVGKCMVSSTHHQMMMPFLMPTRDYMALGWASPNMSDLNRANIEGMYHGNYHLPYEPEVIYFTKTRALCMQYHPEFMDKSSLGVEVARRYMDKLCNEYCFPVKKTSEVYGVKLADVELRVDNWFAQNVEVVENAERE